MVLLFPPRQDPWAAAAERINLLGADLLAARERLAITAPYQAAQIGIGAPTLAGLTTGATNPTGSTISAALKWLAKNQS